MDLANELITESTLEKFVLVLKDEIDQLYKTIDQLQKDVHSLKKSADIKKYSCKNVNIHGPHIAHRWHMIIEVDSRISVKTFANIVLLCDVDYTEAYIIDWGVLNHRWGVAENRDHLHILEIFIQSNTCYDLYDFSKKIVDAVNEYRLHEFDKVMFTITNLNRLIDATCARHEMAKKLHKQNGHITCYFTENGQVKSIEKELSELEPKDKNFQNVRREYTTLEFK